MNDETFDNNEPSDPTTDKSANGSPRRKRRSRRGRSAAQTIDYSVPSPCIAICEYNDEGFCKGCLRNADEIRDWIIMGREQKLQVLDLIAERRLASRP